MKTTKIKIYIILNYIVIILFLFSIDFSFVYSSSNSSNNNNNNSNNNLINIYKKYNSCSNYSDEECKNHDSCTLIPVYSCCFEYKYFCVDKTNLPIKYIGKNFTDSVISNINSRNDYYRYGTNRSLSFNINSFCFRNKLTKQTYQFPISFELPDEYESFKIHNKTCDMLNCESNGMMCTNSSNYQTCSSLDYFCCHNICECEKESKDIPYSSYTHIEPCDLKCSEGFTCRVMGQLQKCLPKSCKYLKCDHHNECIESLELGIATCFLKKNHTDIIESCNNIECPPNFYCGKGLFTDYDCIPIESQFITDLELLHKYNCSLCPVDFICNPFPWGIICTESSVYISNIDNCYGTACVSLQFCNDTTHRCEFHRCNSTLCNVLPNSDVDLQCVQLDVTHPRVCTNLQIVDFQANDWDSFQYKINADYFSEDVQYSVK